MRLFLNNEFKISSFHIHHRLVFVGYHDGVLAMKGEKL